MNFLAAGQGRFGSWPRSAEGLRDRFRSALRLDFSFGRGSVSSPRRRGHPRPSSKAEIDPGQGEEFARERPSVAAIRKILCLERLPKARAVFPKRFSLDTPRVSNRAIWRFQTAIGSRLRGRKSCSSGCVRPVSGLGLFAASSLSGQPGSVRGYKLRVEGQPI